MDGMTFGREVKAGEELCSMCKLVDFRIIQLWLKEEKDDSGDVVKSTWNEKKLDLGYVDEIVNTDACALCRLVTKAFQMSYTKPPLRTLDGERLRCFIPAANYSFWAQEGSENGTRRKNWELSINLEKPPSKDLEPDCRSLFQTAIRLDSVDAHQVASDEGVYSLGRIYNPQNCDPAFLVESYRACKDFHGAGCETAHHQLSSKSLQHLLHEGNKSIVPPEKFRIIDVLDCQVIQAPEQCEYVVLSYVWGTEPFLRLTAHTHAQLTAPGGLKSTAVPRTIREAMELVAKIGERYLWVDALCILQDDDTDKLKQINQMDSIYGFASLTIVAGGGDSVTAGLEGYAPNSRSVTQHTEKIQGLRFIAMGSPLRAVLPSLRWNSRAWTYQEFWLSKRLLIFTPHQVFFVCASEPVNEDSIHYDLNFRTWYFSDTERIASARTVDPGFPDFPWRKYGNHKPNNRGFLSERVTKNLAGHQAYKTLVRDYTRRGMTHEGDVLYAVFGVLRSVAPFKDDVHLCGLPESILDWALLWQPLGPLHRRSAAMHQFPSWSWVGWVGSMGYTEPGDGARSVATILLCHLIQKPCAQIYTPYTMLVNQTADHKRPTF
jgi:hypothetical protein